MVEHDAPSKNQGHADCEKEQRVPAWQERTAESMTLSNTRLELPTLIHTSLCAAFQSLAISVSTRKRS